MGKGKSRAFDSSPPDRHSLVEKAEEEEVVEGILDEAPDELVDAMAEELPIETDDECAAVVVAVIIIVDVVVVAFKGLEDDETADIFFFAETGVIDPIKLTA